MVNAGSSSRRRRSWSPVHSRRSRRRVVKFSTHGSGEVRFRRHRTGPGCARQWASGGREEEQRCGTRSTEILDVPDAVKLRFGRAASRCSGRGAGRLEDLALEWRRTGQRRGCLFKRSEAVGRSWCGNGGAAMLQLEAQAVEKKLAVFGWAGAPPSRDSRWLQGVSDQSPGRGRRQIVPEPVTMQDSAQSCRSFQEARCTSTSAFTADGRRFQTTGARQTRLGHWFFTSWLFCAGRKF